jgi:rhamnosyltransferase subunit B
MLWWLASRVYIDPAVLPELNAFRVAHKLGPIQGFLQHMHEVGDAAVGLFPPWFGARQADWPAGFIEGDFPVVMSESGARLSPPLEAFLSGGEAPIAFTPGTGNRHAQKYFVTALTALKRLGRRGLFITPHAEQIPRGLPTQVMWINQAPFDLLLPSLAVLVHHGGIGTIAQAFRSGTPQLIVPCAFDQFDNAIRAQRLGVAEVLLPQRLSVRRLHKLLTQLLSSRTVVQASAEMRERTASGQRPEELIEKIETALLGHGVPKSGLS